jgi:hypothetical protein
MLTIREEQRRAFERPMRQSFYDRMQQHIEKYFPDHAAALDGEQSIALFDYAIEQGKQYDFISERNVCLFADLMLVFGLDFDTSPDHPWATKVLADPSQNHPDVKMDVLHKLAMQSLNSKL